MLPLPKQFNIETHDVYYPSFDGIKLHGWRLPARGDYKGTILFLHGNGANISNHVSAVYWLPDYGYEVYIVDYRGYGRSEGIPDLDGVLGDIDASIEFVVNEINSNDKLIVIGQSLGAALGTYVLSQAKYKQRIQAYISIAGFSDYRSIVRDVLSTRWFTWILQWPVSLSMNNQYRPGDFVADVSPIPLFIMHSKTDEIVPFYHSKILYLAAKQPKQFSELVGGHNTIFNYISNRERLIDYLEQMPK